MFGLALNDFGHGCANALLEGTDIKLVAGLLGCEKRYEIIGTRQAAAVCGDNA
jgi:hypothetical protein